MVIRCPKCSSVVRVVECRIREHHKPEPVKTWCGKGENDDTDLMIDVREVCRWSGAKVEFPRGYGKRPKPGGSNG